MKILILSLLVVLASACKDNDFTTNSTDNGSNGDQSSPANVPGDLLGSWSKPCASAGAQGGFARNSITVDTQTATFMSQVYQTSSDCSGTPDLESRANFNYTIPTFVAGQKSPINLTMNAINARFNTATAVALANASSFCGFTDWQVSVERNVTGRNCIADLPAAGQPYYHLFQVTGSQLFIGQIDSAHSGRTPETRPTELESTPYAR